jgi:hypothetical protein
MFIARLVNRVDDQLNLGIFLRAAHMDVFSRKAPENDEARCLRNLRLVIPPPEGGVGVYGVINVRLRQVYDRIVFPFNEERKNAYLSVPLAAVPHVTTRYSHEHTGTEKREKLPTNERPRPALVASRRAHRSTQNLSDRNSRAAHPYPRVQL